MHKYILYILVHLFFIDGEQEIHQLKVMLRLRGSKIFKVQSMQIYKVNEPGKKVEVKYWYCYPSFHAWVQAYTKYHYCSLCSSWEMNLNIRVKDRDDANIQSKWTVKYR